MPITFRSNIKKNQFMEEAYYDSILGEGSDLNLVVSAQQALLVPGETSTWSEQNRCRCTGWPIYLTSLHDASDEVIPTASGAEQPTRDHFRTE